MLQQYWKLSFPAQTLLVPEQAELHFVLWTASISSTQKQESKYRNKQEHNKRWRDSFHSSGSWNALWCLGILS